MNEQTNKGVHARRITKSIKIYLETYSIIVL